ncbi:iron ABC transporter permease [uncultured Cohaesibacter sp.]|uniref:FecCD family ABC transporter permease n=1 Tax=uncultured Cohaesibacter sp. TaxID=1002546 RepID=UPI0029C6BBFF|nr:iron ABC transporter permease [uncultured Cohaesibacter sp.]
MKIEQSLDKHRSLVFTNGLHIRLHNLGMMASLLVGSLLLAIISLSIGSTQMDPGDLFAILWSGTSEADQAFAIWDVRLPRLLLGFMAGWTVALTGAMLQSLVQNPLADPGLLGLSQGSMVTITLLLVFYPSTPASLFPFAGLAGGIAVGVLLLLLLGRSNSGGLPVLLMGIAIETTLSSVTMILILYTVPETSYALAAWMAGTLFNANWSSVAEFSPWFALTALVIFFLGRSLKVFDLGEQAAMALGEPIAVTRPVILLAAILLTSATTAVVGPLVFLGIMAPHIASFLSPATGRPRLLLSAMIGGLLVMGADALTRLALGDIALPTGLSIVMIGAPAFIIILRMRALRRVSQS